MKTHTTRHQRTPYDESARGKSCSFNQFLSPLDLEVAFSDTCVSEKLLMMQIKMNVGKIAALSTVKNKILSP